MNVDKISSADALGEGAELWVLPLQQDPWWDEINYRSGFLLSQSLLFQKKEPSTAIENVLKETDLVVKKFEVQKKTLLLGTENHFFNRWILIVNELSQDVIPEIQQTCESLKVQSLRLFSFPKPMIEKIQTRPLASLKQITFVE